MQPVDTQNTDVIEFDLNIHVARLLINEPFFASLSRRVDKRSTEIVPTAAVMVNPHTAQFEMLYNPRFFATLTDPQRRDIIKHEMYHIIFEHLTGRKPDDVKKKLWNYATDLAINSHLSNLPEGCLMPGQEGTPFATYPVGMSAEWYFKKLQDDDFDPEEQEGPGDQGESGDEEGGEQGQQGDGNGQGNGMPKGGQFDSHEHWDNCDPAAQEIAKERLKESLRKAAEECSKNNNWGSVSAETRREIMKRISSTVDWKKVLRYFIKTSQRANKSATIKRINRRYPYVHPGRKTQRQANIAISIDQSGSVDDGMLAQFFAELNKLADLAQFTVIPFDSDVATDKVYVWKKGEKRNWERVRYGGTDFNPPTDYVNQNGFDGHIILTDLCAPKPKPSKCQRMWMTTEHYARHPYFSTNERVIAITEAS